MELLDVVRRGLDEMKKISEELTELDKELRVNRNNDQELYGKQFRLILDIHREYENVCSVLHELEKKEDMTFICRRLKKQADAFIGEKKSYDIK